MVIAEDCAINLVDILLLLVGLFYSAGAWLVTRAALTSMFLDRAIAGISAKKPTRIQTLLPAWHIGSAAIVLAGGLALALRLDAAAWLFVLSALGQGLYLGLLGPRYFDIEEPPDPQGRQQTTNAFVIYCAATSLVLWALYTGKLQSWDKVGLYWLVAAGGVLSAYMAWVLKQFAWRLANPASNASLLGSDNAERTIDPAEVRRVKVMADYHCHPLWSLDEDLYGTIDPVNLGLSADLTRDLAAWAVAYDASMSLDEPTKDLWSSAEREAHEAQGRELAVRLAAERPDLTVFAWDLANGGAIEVSHDRRRDARS